MRTLLLVATFVFATYALADVAEECRLIDDPADKIINLSGDAGSFNQPMVNDRYVTALGGEHGHMYDLQDGKAHPIQEEIDPFPTPDGKFIINPGPLKIYRFEDCLKDGPKAKPFYTDREHNGYYQSVGQYTKNGETYYRVLTAEGEGNIRDYKIIYKNGVAVGAKPVQKKPVALCPELRNLEIGLDFSMPIISKKADEFAVMDERTSTTKIFGFDPVSGKCTEKEDLGIDTGKVNFSYDGTKIAFDSIVLKYTGIDKTPSTTYGRHAFVYDRVKKTMTPLTSMPGRKSEGYYPGFLSDDRIVYQRLVDDGTKNRWGYPNHARSYVIVDPKKVSGVPWKELPDNLKPCFHDIDHYNSALVALGGLWTRVCNAGSKDIAVAAMVALSLDKNTCRKLVEKHWDEKHSQWVGQWVTQNGGKIDASKLADLTPQALLAACPDNTQYKKAVVQGVAQASGGAMPKLFQTLCIGCHAPNSPHGHIPFDNPNAMASMKPSKSSSNEASLTKEVLRRLKIYRESAANGEASKENRMPPMDGIAISDKDMSEIDAYLHGTGTTTETTTHKPAR